MSASPASSNGEQFFSVRRHGEVAVVVVSAAIEDLPANAIETAAQVVLSPLKENPPSNVIVDLAQVAVLHVRVHLLPAPMPRHREEAPRGTRPGRRLGPGPGAAPSDCPGHPLGDLRQPGPGARGPRRGRLTAPVAPIPGLALMPAENLPFRIRRTSPHARSESPTRRERPQTTEDFVREIKEAADKLLVDGATRGDVKLLVHRVQGTAPLLQGVRPVQGPAQGDRVRLGPDQAGPPDLPAGRRVRPADGARPAG